jgi:hypothetical protein
MQEVPCQCKLQKKMNNPEFYAYIQGTPRPRQKGMKLRAYKSITSPPLTGESKAHMAMKLRNAANR